MNTVVNTMTIAPSLIEDMQRTIDEWDEKIIAVMATSWTDVHEFNDAACAVVNMLEARAGIMITYGLTFSNRKLS